MADFIELLYPSRGVLNLESELLWSSLRTLTYPPDYETNPYWKTKIGHTYAVLRTYIYGQFIRKSLDKRFEGYKMPRHWAKTLKQQINYQAALLSQIWDAIKLLPMSPTPRPVIFHEINLEGALVSFNFLVDGECVTAEIKKQQHTNKILYALQNPFDREINPETWTFIENCIEQANLVRDFESCYRILIQIRMSLVDTIKKSLPKKFDQSGKAKEKRGRKSIPLSRAST